MTREVRDNVKDDKGLFSLLKVVCVGDFVELIGDRGFFQKGDNEPPEKYAGYVASLTDKDLGISTTPNSNRFHGYNSASGIINQPRNVTEIEIRLITSYRKL